MNLADLPIGDHAPEIVHAIVETPRKSRIKYLYDLELELFRLKRVLHSAVQYPTAYGFVPQTVWDDNEPLDIMILTDEAMEPGILVNVRPIGLLVMKDEKTADHKVLAVPAGDPRYNGMTDITSVSTHVLKEIEHFFETYKYLEKKHVESFGWSTRDFALGTIRRAMLEYTRLGSWAKHTATT